ncbi:Hypothetical_protein [Hexamita inflata]|uniref:Hypothetical_protein n=1 Tax=Hexamita inflata TaxID=28002 RepID=A0AA86Q0W8_9EUKA|nr:Hypothetical protein HINF_LOCUS37699 [Hexamita inflata]
MRLSQIAQKVKSPDSKGLSELPSTSLQDWKAATAPLLPQKRRWYAGGFPYRSAPECLNPSHWLPWLRRCAQRTQVYLKLMIIRVNLQFLYRRPNQYKRKLSEWDIYKKIMFTNYQVNQTIKQKYNHNLSNISRISCMQIRSFCFGGSLQKLWQFLEALKLSVSFSFEDPINNEYVFDSIILKLSSSELFCLFVFQEILPQEYIYFKILVFLGFFW